MDKSFVIELMNGKTERSMQKAIGPSEIGGCRRRTWMRLNNAPRTNESTLGMAAWMGTAIHKQLEDAMQRQDPWGERYLIEHTVTVELQNGKTITGHVDVYDKQNKEVVDWKTTTKNRLKDFPSDQQRTQVHIYGFLLANNGHDVENVTLVGIPRDGNENNIVIHTEPYDPEIAVEGFFWLDEIACAMTPPEPEKHVRFCMNYCNFYDATGDVGCPGLRGKD